MRPESVPANAERNPTLEAVRIKALRNLGVVLGRPEESALRQHQMSMMQALHDCFAAGQRGGYISATGGAGKSAVMVVAAEAMGLKTVIVSPTQFLMDQTHEEARKFTPGLSVTDYDARRKDLKGQVINTTYASLRNLVDKKPSGFDPKKIELILCDEAHEALGRVTHQVYRQFPNALMVGLTGTPEFSPIDQYIDEGVVEKDENWLCLFKNMICELTREEAMERGISVHLGVNLVTTDIRARGVRAGIKGEYDQKDLEKAFRLQSRDALILAIIAGVESIPRGTVISDRLKRYLEELHRETRGKRTMVFALSRAHADQLARQSRELGVSAAAFHSGVDPDGRTRVLESHKKGDTQVVIGVNMLATGVDSPPTEVTIHSKPTRSGTVLSQQLARGARPSPATGKTDQIAIQFIDDFAINDAGPVLISDLFDPEYVLRGSKRSQAATSPRTTPEKKPVITFSGMNIDAIIEEATSRELIRRRFARADIVQIHGILERMYGEALTKNPRSSAYELAKVVNDSLPARLPKEVQRVGLQALASIDPNTQQLGRMSLFFLNLKSLVSAVDSFYRDDNPDLDPEERDEFFAVAIAAFYEALSRIQPNRQITAQINIAIKAGIVNYISQMHDLPRSLARNPWFREIITDVEREAQLPDFSPDSARTTRLITSLSQETGASEKDLIQYITNRHHINLTGLDKENDDSYFMPERSGYQDTVTGELVQAVDSLSDRETQIINLLYGNNFSLEEVGEKIGVTRERVRQIETKALKRLRQSSRTRKLKRLLSDDAEPPIVTMYDVYEQNRGSTPVSVFLSGQLLNLSRRAGIRHIGDFFSTSYSELSSEWNDDNYLLFETADHVRRHLAPTYVKINDFYDRQPIEAADLSLIKEISDAIIYRFPNDDYIITNLRPLERLVLAASLDRRYRAIGLIKVNDELRRQFDSLRDYDKARIEYEARQKIFIEAYRRF